MLVSNMPTIGQRLKAFVNILDDHDIKLERNDEHGSNNSRKPKR